jgi:hypothetical protein
MRDDDELKRCHAEIRRLEAENQDLRRASESFGDLADRLNQKLLLRAENQDLRRASESFGDLADRLNQKLYSERRLRTTDRRQTPRDPPDRHSMDVTD